MSVPIACVLSTADILYYFPLTCSCCYIYNPGNTSLQLYRQLYSFDQFMYLKVKPTGPSLTIQKSLSSQTLEVCVDIDQPAPTQIQGSSQGSEFSQVS